MFKKVDNKNIPEVENEVLEYWKKNKIFEKSVESRSDNNRYIFYDGPPFISGLPHPGHLLSSVAKDLIPRYWTMKGKKVERVWGWDAHGLTVENKVQKKLGIKNRRDIESYGLDDFTQACYEYTSETSDEWEWYVDRIGRWVDFKNSYKTTDQSYMESVIWAFSELYKNGMIYEGVYTSLYCTTCGTPVSNFEIAMDNTYHDVEDPAIIVKFPILEGKYEGVNLLAWTTTPWTIPSNRALVVNPELKYLLVSYNNEKHIVAKDRVEDVFNGLNYSTENIDIKDILGLKYRPPFTFYKSKDNEFKVYEYEGMVNSDEGTGIVHSAPGFGEIDTQMGKYYDLTVMLTIDDEGKFIEGSAGNNPYSGMYFKKADKYIIEDLKSSKLLFKSDRILHRFPYHDRCNTNLIQRAQNSWFIDIKKIKSELLKNNEDINWVPDYLKEGRFKIGIEQAPDWCISRNRFWATPMPIWESEDGDRIVVSSIDEIEKLSGQKVQDLHRPYIDEIVIEKNEKKYYRREEVLDSWMEAGSMPYAQIHYPFENKKKFEENFPGDYIVEYIGQVRAWFYVMHVLSTSLFGKASFKNVISTGVMAGNDGRKMSKTYGNFTDPKENMEKFGADALRLYLMNSPLMIGGNSSFDDAELQNKLRNVINPLYNSFKFFLIYAELNGWDVNVDDKEKPNKLISDNILDKWILSRLEETIKGISRYIEKYEVPDSVQYIEDFVNDLSTWYVRRSRDRINSGNNEALNVFYTVLVEFSKASAPTIPFITEYIYQNLVKPSDKNAFESIHLCDYPEINGYRDEEIENKMNKIRNIASVGNSIRKENNLPIKQPLYNLFIEQKEDIGNEYNQLLIEELNIKNVIYSEKIEEDENLIIKEENGIKVAIDTTIDEKLTIEKNYREFVREIQKLRKTADVEWNEYVEIEYPSEEKWLNVVSEFEDELKTKTYVSNLIKGDKFEIFKS